MTWYKNHCPSPNKVAFPHLWWGCLPASSRWYPRDRAAVGFPTHTSSKTGLVDAQRWHSSHAKNGVCSGLSGCGGYRTSRWPLPTLDRTTDEPRHPRVDGGTGCPVLATSPHPLHRHVPGVAAIGTQACKDEFSTLAGLTPITPDPSPRSSSWPSSSELGG